MDVKFDAKAAEQLINNMGIYCTGIRDETTELLKITRDLSGWKDNQAEAFNNNINALTEDLKTALIQESEYMKTYHQKVTELRR